MSMYLWEWGTLLILYCQSHNVTDVLLKRDLNVLRTMFLWKVPLEMKAFPVSVIFSGYYWSDDSDYNYLVCAVQRILRRGIHGEYQSSHFIFDMEGVEGGRRKESKQLTAHQQSLTLQLPTLWFSCLLFVEYWWASYSASHSWIGLGRKWQLTQLPRGVGICSSRSSFVHSTALSH